jgi:cytochrome P450
VNPTIPEWRSDLLQCELSAEISTTAGPSLVTFNPADPAFLENPFPFYAMGRQMSPLYLANPGLWLVFGYNDCSEILRDTQSWSAAPPAAPPGTEMPAPSMLSSDPPRHTRLRGLVSQAFTPRMVELLEPRLREIADELLDPIVSTGRADIVEALAYPLPVIVIAEILGVPPEDRDRFKRWSDEVVSLLGTGLGGESRELPMETFEAMRDYFTAMCDERRVRPRNDLISGLVAAEVDGSRLSGDEMLQMLILLLVAGNETTTNLIGNAIIEFMNYPAQLQRVVEDPALIPTAIEEVMRYCSPVQATARRPRHEMQIGGETIETGQTAVVWLASANRDPQVFADPDTFDVGRTPNRHLGFGLGVHFCLGAPLARLEAKVALEEFLKRVKDFHRTDDNPLPRVPTFIMRGVRELPIAWTARN